MTIVDIQTAIIVLLMITVITLIGLVLREQHDHERAADVLRATARDWQDAYWSLLRTTPQPESAAGLTAVMDAVHTTPDPRRAS